MSYFMRRRRDSGDGHTDGLIRRVKSVTFCEMDRCSKLADWRIGYGTQSVSFCSRHTIMTMKDPTIWSDS